MPEPGSSRGDHSFGRQGGVIHRESQLDLAARRKDRAGFHIAAAQADVGNIGEHRNSTFFGLHFDRDPALHARMRAAILVGELLLLFQIHAAVGFGQKLFGVVAVFGIHGAPTLSERISSPQTSLPPAGPERASAPLSCRPRPPSSPGRSPQIRRRPCAPRSRIRGSCLSAPGQTGATRDCLPDGRSGR